MLLREIQQLLQAQVLTGSELLERPIQECYGSDMMSEVLAYCQRDALLCTSLTNMQVVRTADMTELGAIVFVRNKRPGAEVIAAAENNNLPLLITELTLWQSCECLLRAGLTSCHKGA